MSEFIELAIQIDNLIRSRHSTRTSSRYMPETTTTADPMQLGFTHITAEEQERCMQNQLCLYCSQAGHSCPVRPSTGSRSVSDPITTSQSSIKLPVKIRIQDKVTTTTALMNSGAAGNFVSLEFAQQQTETDPL